MLRPGAHDPLDVGERLPPPQILPKHTDDVIAQCAQPPLSLPFTIELSPMVATIERVLGSTVELDDRFGRPVSEVGARHEETVLIEDLNLGLETAQADFEESDGDDGFARRLSPAVSQLQPYLDTSEITSLFAGVDHRAQLSLRHDVPPQSIIEHGNAGVEIVISSNVDESPSHGGERGVSKQLDVFVADCSPANDQVGESAAGIGTNHFHSRVRNLHHL